MAGLEDAVKEVGKGAANLNPWAMVGGQALSGLIGGVSSYLSAREQRKAADRAAGTLEKTYGEAKGYQQPFYGAGVEGLDRLRTSDYGVNVPGQYQSGESQPTYSPDQFNFQADPGYQYAQKEGMNQILNQMSAVGGGLSGSTLKAMQKYGTNLANQTYQDSWNRYMGGRQQGLAEHQTGLGQFNQNRQFGAGQQQQQYENLSDQANKRYGRDFDLMNVGQTAAGSLADLASNYGSNMAGLYGQQGNAAASGIMGVGQGIGKIGQGIADFASMYQPTKNPRQVAEKAFRQRFGNI